MCYDEDEDDPWQYFTALQQDCLTDEMKPPRKKTAEYIMNNHRSLSFIVASKAGKNWSLENLALPASSEIYQCFLLSYYHYRMSAKSGWPKFTGATYYLLSREREIWVAKIYQYDLLLFTTFFTIVRVRCTYVHTSVYKVCMYVASCSVHVKVRHSFNQLDFLFSVGD